MRYIKNMIVKKIDIGQFGIKGVIEILCIDDFFMKMKRCMIYMQFQFYLGLIFFRFQGKMYYIVICN